MVIMEAIIRQVRDIDQSERQVLEHVLGRQLKENQQIIIQVVNLASDKSQSPKGGETSAGSDELPEWCNVYDGLSDEQVADVESAILQRANLTRPS
jgi:hypothetical protein